MSVWVNFEGPMTNESLVWPLRAKVCQQKMLFYNRIVETELG